MPFKSEAQRRYLWANEPEIARDWTDTYGSRIQKNDGGIMSMQGGVKNYLGEQPMVNAPKYWQSAPDHEMTELAYITPTERDILVDLNLYGSMQGSPNEGPSGIMSLNGWGSKDESGKEVGMSGTATSAAETGSRNARDIRDIQAQLGTANLGPGVMPEQAKDYESAAINAGAGQIVNPRFFGPKNYLSKEKLARAKAYRNDPNNRFSKQAYRNTRGSRFGIGNILGGLAGLALGIPGLGLGINAVRSLGEYDTLSDWWGSRKNWSKDDKEEVVLSNYQRDPETGKYKYVERVNPAYYDDLGNEEMLSLNDVQSLVQASQIPQGMDWAAARRAITQPTTYTNLPFEGARTVDTYRGVDPYKMNYLNRDLPTGYRSESLLDEQPPSGLETLQPITFEEPTFEPYA